MWHSLEVAEVLRKLDTSKEGLSDSNSKDRILKYGKNISVENKKTTPLQIFLNQFKGVMIYVLLAAAILSFFIGDMVEFYVITGIVVIVVFLSFFEELKAVSDVQALKKLTPKIVKAIRDGKEIDLNAEQLVPGDVIRLTRGCIVPADARVIECADLQVDESALTGESLPSQKSPGVVNENASISERKNILYQGGKIVTGHALAVIVATGKETELGKIGALISSTGDTRSQLQMRLDQVGKQFSYIVIVVSVFIILFGLFRGEELGYLFLLAVAASVAGIPESLPAVIGVALALGMKRMAKKKAILKNLAIVETLGTCTVICSDKTGTLTQNKMVLENIWMIDSEAKVTGAGLAPTGNFILNNKGIDPQKHKHMSKIIEIGILCNNSSLKSEKGEWMVDGESTEGSLVVLAKKAGLEKEDMHKRYPRIHEHPFDPDRKLMSCIHLVDEIPIVYAKGAPERLLKKCSYYYTNGKVVKITAKLQKQIEEKTESYAKSGYRVLALAYKEHRKKSYELKHVEKELVFCGLVAIRDPPHESSIEAIKLCRKAGVRVVMITGDNPVTAQSIGRELDIFRDGDKILTGDDLDALTDEELSKIVSSVSVYARVAPKHKFRVVDILQKQGEIVAMTGDGVNDAPALKKANIGVAMGTGTDVAKEASDVILLDDNFVTIVSAVEEGRTIYSNIQKFVYYLFPSNFTQMAIVLLAMIAGVVPPLTPIMILFINLVTSDIPAMGLCAEKPDKGIMLQKPRHPVEDILNHYVILKIFQAVPFMIFGTLGMFLWTIVKGESFILAQTVAFVTLILFILFHAFNAKAMHGSVFSRSTLNNTVLFIGYGASFLATFVVVYVSPINSMFGLVPVPLNYLISILVVTSSIVLVSEVQKILISAEIVELEKEKEYLIQENSGKAAGAIDRENSLVTKTRRRSKALKV